MKPPSTQIQTQVTELHSDDKGNFAWWCPHCGLETGCADDPFDCFVKCEDCKEEYKIAPVKDCELEGYEL